KGLAGGSDQVDPKCIWNRYLMQEFMPVTVANAFEKLLKWMFRAEAQGGPKAKEIEYAIEQYFKFWPLKVKMDGVQGQNDVGMFSKRFLRTSYVQPIFPCRFARMTPSVIGHKGCEVVFTGKSLNNVPGSINRVIRGRLQSMGINVCDCSDRIQTQIETDWKSSTGSAALNFSQIDPDLVRRLIREDPMFIPKSAKTVEEKRWILGFTLEALLDTKALAAMSEPLKGLALIPLMNGEWKELQTEGPLSPVYYTAKPAMRELIKGANVLVDESLFRNVKDPKQGETHVVTNLERILSRLVKDTPFCIKEMPPEKFAEVICAENPNGVPVELRDKVWRLLDTFEDLRPFGEVPILKTLDGDIKPLKHAFQGLEISTIQDVNFKQSMRDLAMLLRDLAIVVLDAAQNNRHPYLLKQ
ncbi:hypothetical protein BGZ65_011840, partial [Modicella reniformis]